MSEEIQNEESSVSETPEANETELGQALIDGAKEALEGEQPSEEPSEDSATEEEEKPEAELPELSDEQVQQILAGRRFKVKIDGEEKEVDLDTMTRDYQLASASQKRFKEAATLKKEAEAFVELLRKDPTRALTHPDIGVDVKKLAEDILIEELEQANLSPEERELRELKRQLAAKEEAERAAKEEAEKAQLDAEAVKWAEDFNSKAPQALEKHSLPVNTFTMTRLRDYAIEGLENGYEIPADQLASLVKEDYQSAIKELFSSSPDIIRSLVGEDNLKKIRDIDLQRIKDPKAEKDVKVSKSDTKARKSPEDFDSMEEYFEYLHSVI